MYVTGASEVPWFCNCHSYVMCGTDQNFWNVLVNTRRVPSAKSQEEAEAVVAQIKANHPDLVDEVTPSFIVQAVGRQLFQTTCDTDCSTKHGHNNCCQCKGRSACTQCVPNYSLNPSGQCIGEQLMA